MGFLFLSIERGRTDEKPVHSAVDSVPDRLDEGCSECDIGGRFAQMWQGQLSRMPCAWFPDGAEQVAMLIQDALWPRKAARVHNSGNVK